MARATFKKRHRELKERLLAVLLSVEPPYAGVVYLWV